MNQSLSKIEKLGNSPRQQCQLPSLYYDYSARKKQKLKTYFRKDQCISNSPKKNETSSLQRQSIKVTQFEKKKIQYTQQDEINESAILLRPSRHVTSNMMFKKPEIDVNKPKTERIIENDTPINIDDLNSSISQSDDQNQEENTNKMELQVEGETGKALKHISHRLNQDLNHSFYNFIKKSEKMKDLILNFQQKDVLSPIHYYCLNDSIFPKRIEFNNKQDLQEINLSDLGLTPKYIPLIRNLINQKKDKNIKLIDISLNKINEWSLKLLIDVFPIKVKTINLSNNQLNRRGAVLLASHLKKFQNLRVLNLKGNQIGDVGSATVLEALKTSVKIKKLNLSENCISDANCIDLKDFIAKNISLEMLSLNWNQLGPTAGQFIAKGFEFNRSIRVLDLSYNKIGQGDNNFDCIKEWCSVLSNSNIELVHLDLSYNQLNEKQLALINYSIIRNSKLYGLHVEGNKYLAYVDPLGFISFPKQHQSKQQISSKHQDIDGVNYIQMINENENGYDCCWICQGWMEYNFVYEPEQDEENIDCIYLHLDFLDFKPISMTTSKELWKQINAKIKTQTIQDNLTTGEIIHQLKYAFDTDKKITMTAINDAYQENTKLPIEMSSILTELNSRFFFTSYQMCPPNQKILYFFSNPTGKGIFINPRFPTIELKSLENIEVIQDKNKIFSYPNGIQISLSQLQYVNYFQTKQMFVIDQKNQYKPLVKVIPRNLENKYFLKRFAVDASKQKSNLIFWQKEQSAFKSYQGDNQDVLEECMQFDWNCFGIMHFLKQDQDVEQVYKILRQNFPILKDVYKYYSSFGFDTKQQNNYLDCFNVPIHMLSQLIEEFQMKEISIEDQQNQIKQIKYNSDQKYIYNPSSGLVRYQFIEFLLRLTFIQAKLKQRTNYIADETYKTFKMLSDRFKAFDNQQQWREQRLWTKECGNMIYIKQGFIQKLHEYAASINNKKWSFKLKWISLYEFIEFCNQMEFSKYLSEIQLKIIYNFSMQTHQDELTQDRHLRMSSVEFTEAIARIAEYISPCFNENQICQIERQCLPLHIKLECLFTYIYQTIKKLKVNNFDCFQLYFNNDEQQWQPSNFQLQSDNYECTTIQLKIYNTLSYLSNFPKPYLHPNYKQFLQNPYQLQEKVIQISRLRRSTMERQKTQKQKLLKLKATLQEF